MIDLSIVTELLMASRLQLRLLTNRLSLNQRFGPVEQRTQWKCGRSARVARLPHRIGDAVHRGEDPVQSRHRGLGDGHSPRESQRRR